MSILISLEGLDGNFKETNSKKLVSYLEGLGKKVHLFSFPDYSINSIEMIKHCMDNKAEYPDTSEGRWQKGIVTAISFMQNKIESFIKNDIFKLIGEDSNTVIVFDRYIISNILYQCATIKNYESGSLNVTNMMFFLNHLETTIYGLPEEDLCLFLTLSKDNTFRILSEKKGTDTYEKDFEYLGNVYDNIPEVISFAKSKNKDRLVLPIECDEDEKIRTEEEIFTDIKNAVDLLIKYKDDEIKGEE